MHSSDLLASLGDVLLEDDDAPPRSIPGYVRASRAGYCGRRNWYEKRDEPVSDPAPVEGRVNIAIGRMLGKHLFTALQRLYPDAEPEVEWTLDNAAKDHGVIGHADARYTDEQGRRCVAEFKTSNPFSYGHTAREGVPKREHLLQASINGLQLGTGWLSVIYLNTSPRPGSSVMIAEYLVDPLLAARELERLLATAEDDTLPMRTTGAEDLNPNAHAMHWMCSICAWRSKCIVDGLGDA